MGGFFAPPDPPDPEPLPIEETDEEAERELQRQARRRRGLSSTIRTSATGLLSPSDGRPRRKNLLGE